MTDEYQQLIDEVIELTYFMRGGVTYDQMMNRTYLERFSMQNFLRKRLETESKRTTPIY